jgi:hypothetical protein
VRVILSDAVGRMRPDALEGAIQADLAAGLRPLAVVANAGSTAVGAIDPFAEISRVCIEHGVWMHVDGAYGAFACLSERGAASLSGMELADSITLDPHKWLYQPIEVGALLVRDGALLRRAFEITPLYLREITAIHREVNFSDLGVQLTRSARALKVWMSLRHFGLAAFRQAIDNCLDLTLEAQRRIERSSELELVTPASLGVLTFRRHPAGVDDERTLERINADLVSRVESGGEVFVSTTHVRGRYAVRLCILNHSTGWPEVLRAIELIESMEVDIGSTPAAAPRDRDATLVAGWLSRPALDAEGLKELPLFADLDDEQADNVLRTAREITAEAGETVVGRWQTSRDLFVVLSGSVRVEADGSVLGTLAAGRFFGELAAVDWGASYGRARAADVIAVEPVRLLALDWQLVAALMDSAIPFREMVEQVARERLSTL